MSTPAAVIEKIAKCDRLANSPIAGEAAAARAMAAKLRAKYQISNGTAQFSESKRYPFGDNYSGYDPTYRPSRDPAYEAAFKANVDRHLDKIFAESLYERLTGQGIAVVQVDGGWLMATTGAKVLSDRQLIAEAKKAGFA